MDTLKRRALWGGIGGALFPLAALLLLTPFEDSSSPLLLVPLALHSVASLPGFIIAPLQGWWTLGISSLVWGLLGGVGAAFATRRTSSAAA